ncbi:hypothetical protein LZZ85_21175 [Terrimonas sp. NA20]|uniref:Uncharacterized protein n=1 Tax=Terrimonas ginsenosidimutans TaxID=2908004 RepID=A0ABS9KWT3_9BACT|nr:hypothetical protein [Terrimonas ginsenosidimutans]MCG2616822.1 hypothetical protein [Terrimonas ginsenosidimutans]
MRYKLFSWWKVLRYALCALIAFWGGMMVFMQGRNSGGRILLLIASVGVFSTMVFDLFDKHLQKRK